MKRLFLMFSILLAESCFAKGLISGNGYGQYKFGDPMPTDMDVYQTTDNWISSRYEPLYGSRDNKDEYGFSIAMKKYWRNGKGLFRINLSQEAGAVKPEGYDAAFQKFADFKAMIEQDLGMSLPDIQIVVPKDRYDKTIAEKKAEEEKERSKGRHISCEWIVFAIPTFNYGNARISIYASAWTGFQTTINMGMSHIDKNVPHANTSAEREKERKKSKSGKGRLLR